MWQWTEAKQEPTTPPSSCPPTHPYPVPLFSLQLKRNAWIANECRSGSNWQFRSRFTVKAFAPPPLHRFHNCHQHNDTVAVATVSLIFLSLAKKREKHAHARAHALDLGGLALNLPVAVILQVFLALAASSSDHHSLLKFYFGGISGYKNPTGRPFEVIQLMMEMKCKWTQMNATSWMGLMTVSEERAARSWESHQHQLWATNHSAPPPTDLREARRSQAVWTYLDCGEKKKKRSSLG